MSGKAEDLFGDSSSDGGDTDDLIAESNKKAAAKKKGGGGGAKKLQKKRKRDVPDADFDDSDDDEAAVGGKGSDDDAGGLFDSDDSDDDSGKKKKSKKLKKKKESGGGGKKKGKKSDGGDGNKKLSKKEKMALLAKKARGETGGVSTTEDAESSLARDAARRKRKEDGEYDSEDSYDSREFVRTKEDDDFIDASGEDPDALAELYREQHFDDERPSGSESEDDEGRKIKKKKKAAAKKGRGRGPDALGDVDLNGDEPPDNPIMAAVHKMKKKKKEVKKLTELEDEAREFLRKMEQAAEEDEESIRKRRPAMKKLKLLPEVLNMITKREMMRPLLDHDLLGVCRRWVQPLPNGGLGNVTLRQKLLQGIGNMTGENGVSPSDLRRSGFGKTVMALYMHKSETPELKRFHKALIERWSRPIFQKSGNMRDLEKAQKMRRADAGITGYAAAARAAQIPDGRDTDDGRGRSGTGGRDLSSIIAGGDNSAKDSVNNRVRVPFSKGFQFSVRPTDRAGDIRDKRTRTVNVNDRREGLHKRMIEKGRPISKNKGSANLSIEGRPAK